MGLMVLKQGQVYWNSDMTIFEPSLFFKRLIVYSNSDVAYDQTFHNGVNVIWGHNGTGKTTILQFLYYAIGGNLPDWKPIAKRCDRVICELEINGETVCTQRFYSETPFQPMSILMGDIDTALLAPSTDWKVYPYSRGRGSSGKESFSQVLFDAMDMPHVPTSDTNITMDQMLRLIYQNQFTSPQKIFRDQDWDSSNLTKQTVGEFLCGIYDPNLYENQLKLRSVIKLLQTLGGEQRGLVSALGILGEDFDISVIAQDQRNALKENEELQDRLKKVAAVDDSSTTKQKSDNEKNLDNLRKSINKDAEELARIGQEIDSKTYQLTESERFLSSLKDNLSAFEKSEETQNILGNINFEFCPACFTPVAKAGDDSNCKLCKEHDDDDGRGHRIRWRREMEMQISETQAINDALSEARDELTSRQRVLKAKNKKQRVEYFSKKTTVISFADQKIREISERIGWLDRQLEVLAERFEIGKRIEKIINDIAKNEGIKSALESKISLAMAAQEKIRNESYSLLSNILIKLLKEDLLSDGFKTTKAVAIDFGKETISVNGETRFAASSHVYLKNCFGLALLLASVESRAFRFPRLLLLDAIEDKGLDEERIHHFQELLLEHSEKSRIKHQIILTSQTLTKKLQSNNFIIDKYYPDGDHTLNLK